MSAREKMADWMYNKNGRTCLILDGETIRSEQGIAAGWISNGDVYSLRGMHIGWFEGGVIYDDLNSALAFTSNHAGQTPSTPGLAGAPSMPGFAGTPGRPGFTGAPGRPGRGGWSASEPSAYFTR
jgi:hypothetical protein